MSSRGALPLSALEGGAQPCSGYQKAGTFPEEGQERVYSKLRLNSVSSRLETLS